MLRAVIIIAVLVAVKGDECVPRSFGKDSIVCVCNSTYCDSTPKMPKLEESQYVMYTSTRDGKRMHLSVNNFSTENVQNELKIFKNNERKNLSLLVDCNQTYQEIEGFGGAMTDAAAINIRSLSNETQYNLLESYFGFDGIGYTFVRIPIAGTDFSTRPYTYDDTPGDITLSNFKLVEEDDYKIEYLHHIKNIMPNPNDLRIFTTAWSAPAWMKTTHSITWGFLKQKYYQLYADYIKKFFDAYKDRGIDIWGITPGNEPLDGLIPFFPFNAMAWMPDAVANWSTIHLAPTLIKAGYNLTYMALDDQRFEIPWCLDSLFENEEAKKLFTGTAFHWYADTFSLPTRLVEMHEKYPDKFMLMTEACTGSNPLEKEKVILGSWTRGEKYVTDIIQNLSNWVVGWIDWNIALDECGRPNWAKNFVDSPIIVNRTNDEFYKQPMYYALNHFSKFVPRGSRRISSTGLEFNQFIKAIAFSTPNQEIVIVTINKGSSPVAITIKDKKTDNKMNVNLPAKSFNTLVYSVQK